jgi:hypothetical protein
MISRANLKNSLFFSLFLGFDRSILLSDEVRIAAGPL